ncbi:MAG TPA: hypothetical protein VL096_08545 [Pirellulaceae bacterium]|nr:hypothetical protein [Pirellulaceae bacterium]
MPRSILCLLALLSLAMGSSARAADPNPIFQELTTQGVGGQATLKLPAPIMADGLDAAAQRKVIDSIGTPGKQFAELTRKAVVAPFVLKVDEGQSTQKRVDVYFVAYGDLDVLMKEGFRKVDDAEDEKSKEPALRSDATPLSETTLADRGITAKDNHETYMHSFFPLFDRVRVEATVRAIDHRAEDSVTIAAAIDERFNDDKKFPNLWQALRRDEAGKLSVDPKTTPYAAAGAYAKATQLKEPKGAIFVEYHLAYDEPAAWFNGAKLLTAKLPLVAQDGIRKLRRQLEKEEGK